MTILLNLVGYENPPWREVLERELPGMAVLEPHEVSDPAAIRYAAIWQHPHNDLNRYPNLRAILNLGAGADHIDQDPALEELQGVPIVRLLDPDVGIDMAHYVLYWAMHFQRGYEVYRSQAASREWRRFMPPRICDWRVTVLGLGRIGEYIAGKVAQMGFKIQAWNRSARQVDNVAVFSGYDKLDQALSQSDVVVNCLPLKEQTNALLDTKRLACMPAGSYLISVSRGAVVDDDALIAALKSGHIAGAALDCFAEEPLAADSPLWSLPGVHITPHMSGATFARSAALPVVENIQRMEHGEEPHPIHRMT